MIDLEVSRINTLAFSIAHSPEEGIEVGRGLLARRDGDKTTVLMDGSAGLDLAAEASDVWLEESLSRLYGKHRLARITFGSMPVEGQGPIFIPQSPYRIGVPNDSSIAVGTAAMVYMLDNHNLTYTGSPEDPSTPTLLDSKERHLIGRRIGTSLLFLLQQGQELKVASGEGRDTKVFTVTFNPDLQNLSFQDIDAKPESGDDRGLGDSPDDKGKDGGSDRNPKRPIRPSDSAGAAAEVPRSRGSLPPLRGHRIVR